MQNRVRSALRIFVPFACAALAASPALAQDASEVVEVSAAPSPSEPQWRLDILGPTIGIGVFLAPSVGYEQGLFTLGGEVRFAHESGNGALLRVAHGNNLWGGGTVIDLGYLYRLNVTGSAVRGASLDFTVGPSFAWLAHNQGDVPVGAAMGGEAGLGVHGRYDNFAASISGQLHGFAPLEGAPNGGPTGFEMAISLMGGLGFGFYG